MRTLGVEGSINEPHPGIGRNHVSMIPWIIPCVRLKFKVFMKFHVTANTNVRPDKVLVIAQSHIWFGACPFSLTKSDKRKIR